MTLPQGAVIEVLHVPSIPGVLKEGFCCVI